MMKTRKSSPHDHRIGDAYPVFSQRSTQPELIDLKSYSLEEYEDCLVKLNQIGTWLGGDHATFSALNNPQSILDVGCGGGFFTKKLAQKYPNAHIVGIDLNPHAIAFAKKRNALPNLSFELRSEEKLNEPPKSFDVVLSTLVCHHLTDENIISLLSSARQIAKKKVIINDLHRHPLAYYFFKLTSPLFFPNRLIQHDGPLSIRKGFTKKELTTLLNKAGLSYSLKWKWAFRWLLEIDV